MPKPSTLRSRRAAGAAQTAQVRSGGELIPPPVAGRRGRPGSRSDPASGLATGGGIIDGVVIHPLKRIPDERGAVMHMLKATDPHFERFGEIYFSMVYPGVVKGWHRHRRMTINYAVPVGMIKLVLYDDRPASPTRHRLQELFIGESQYCLVKVPPMVWNGFKGIGAAPAFVANCATIPHDPTEIERCDPLSGQIPYDWSLKHR